jgi:hypothetical protein
MNFLRIIRGFRSIFSILKSEKKLLHSLKYSEKDYINLFELLSWNFFGNVRFSINFWKFIEPAGSSHDQEPVHDSVQKPS